MKNKNLESKKKLKKYSKIYNGGHAKRKKKLNGFLKHLILFFIIAIISYFLCVLTYSFINREHKTSVSIPDSYGEEAKTTKNSNASSGNEKKEELYLVAVELPKNLVSKENEMRAFFKKAKQKGKNAVILTLKDDLGNLLYDSEVEKASIWETVVKNPANAKKIIKIAKEEEIIPIAKLNGFLDPKAADPYFKNTFVYKNDPDSIFKFQDKKTYKNKIYLNPYYKSTQEYLLSIVKELYGLGFSDVLISNFCFPKEELSSKIKDYDEFKKDAVLKNLLENLKKTKANIILEYDFDMFSENEESQDMMNNCFGGNVLNFQTKLDSVVVKTNKELKDFLKSFNKLKEKNKQKRFILKLEFKPTEEQLNELEEKDFGVCFNL